MARWELTVRHDSLFINGLRIRETSLGATSCHQMIDLLRTARVGAFSLQDEVEPSEVELFARLLRDMAEGRGSSSDVTRELTVRGVSHIRIPARRGGRGAARRTLGRAYCQARLPTLD